MFSDYGMYGDIWKDISQPFREVGRVFERAVIRPVAHQAARTPVIGPVFKEAGRVVGRITGTIGQGIRYLGKGDILKAAGTFNPAYFAAKAVSDNPHITDYAAMTMPISLTLIQDPKLRHLAVTGYAVAAAVAAAVYVGPAAIAKTLATAKGAIGAVGSAAGLAKEAQTLISGKKEELPVAPDQIPPETPPAEASMFGPLAQIPKPALYFMGATAIFSLVAYMYRTKH
jgi:hypothetical protein